MARRRPPARIPDGNAPSTGAIPPLWVDTAGALYLAGVRGVARRGGSLDRIVAAFLKEHGGLGDAGRGFVVDTAQGMWRVRRRLDAAVQRLPFEPTRAALAALFLIGARNADPRTLPVDARGAPALREAWLATNALPLDVRANMPAWLVDELRTVRDDTEPLCLACTATPPTTLRANRLKATPVDVIEALARDGIEAAPGALAPDAVVLAARANVFRTAAFHEGLFEVQDEGSQLVSLMCEARAGMTVVDGCAGAGGKTLHLAALMEGKGTLYAFDTAGFRLDALRERARRAGAFNVRAHDLEDPAGHKLRKRLKNMADVVLVDAPCSGTGVLRRNPDTAWRLASDDVERMRGQQAEILAAYALLVKPGGRLVYATCSLLPRENQATISAFLAAHPDFTIVPARAILERLALVDGESREGAFAAVGDTLELDPLRHGTDGFFACALQRAR